MSNTRYTPESDFDRIDPMPSTNSPRDRDRDPGSPIARLTEAEKQMALAIHDLETESEYVDPDPLQQLEDALVVLREAANTLDEQARVTDTELRGGTE